MTDQMAANASLVTENIHHRNKTWTMTGCHTDIWNRPDLCRLTFECNPLDRRKLTQLLLYVVLEIHWVLVWSSFQSVTIAYCGCGHTHAVHTETPRKDTHENTHGNVLRKKMVYTCMWVRDRLEDADGWGRVVQNKGFEEAHLLPG